MKRILFFVGLTIVGLVQHAAASNYQYISADKLAETLVASGNVLLVDIQVEKEFAEHHIKGSLETNAYPVKSDAERQVIDPAVAIAKDYDSVVIVCPRGKGGAKRAYDYMKSRGVSEEELFILTGGIAKWPYEKWVVTK
jgi:rhodanese-related sulfurtransferase